jgi:hypothetical protein
MFTWHRWGVTWDPNLLRPAYKWSLYVAFVGCWVAAIYFNGEPGRLQNNLALLFGTAGAITLGSFGWLLLKSDRFRQRALRQDADFAPTIGSLQWITWIATAISGFGALKLLVSVV